jgi:hypothetical protein
MSPSTAKRRPFLVSLIVAVHVLMFFFVAIVAYRCIFLWNSLPETAKANFRATSPMEWTAIGIGMLLTLLSIIQLIRMRRSAFFLYSAATSLGILSTIIFYFSGTLFTGPWVGGSVGTAVGLIIWWYLWSLFRNHVLT